MSHVHQASSLGVLNEHLRMLCQDADSLQQLGENVDIVRGQIARNYYANTPDATFQSAFQELVGDLQQTDVEMTEEHRAYQAEMQEVSEDVHEMALRQNLSQRFNDLRATAHRLQDRLQQLPALFALRKQVTQLGIACAAAHGDQLRSLRDTATVLLGADIALIEARMPITLLNDLWLHYSRISKLIVIEEQLVQVQPFRQFFEDLNQAQGDRQKLLAAIANLPEGIREDLHRRMGGKIDDAEQGIRYEKDQAVEHLELLRVTALEQYQDKLDAMHLTDDALDELIDDEARFRGQGSQLPQTTPRPPMVIPPTPEDGQISGVQLLNSPFGHRQFTFSPQGVRQGVARGRSRSTGPASAQTYQPIYALQRTVSGLLRPPVPRLPTPTDARFSQIGFGKPPVPFQGSPFPSPPSDNSYSQHTGDASGTGSEFVPSPLDSPSPLRAAWTSFFKSGYATRWR